MPYIYNGSNKQQTT